jgi:hypothetical protein
MHPLLSRIVDHDALHRDCKMLEQCRFTMHVRFKSSPALAKLICIKPLATTLYCADCGHHHGVRVRTAGRRAQPCDGALLPPLQHNLLHAHVRLERRDHLRHHLQQLRHGERHCPIRLGRAFEPRCIPLRVPLLSARSMIQALTMHQVLNKALKSRMNAGCGNSQQSSLTARVAVHSLTSTRHTFVSRPAPCA